MATSALFETLAEIVQYEGHPVVSASHGREALRILASNPLPCLMLLDVSMPVMDDWEFRAEQPSDPRLAAVPVVLLSAEDDLRQHALLLYVEGSPRSPLT